LMKLRDGYHPGYDPHDKVDDDNLRQGDAYQPRSTDQVFAGE